MNNNSETSNSSKLMEYLISSRDYELECNYMNRAAMFQRFIDELKELRKRLEWQPMETAPKDGSSVLVYNRDGEVSMSVYEKGPGSWMLVGPVEWDGGWKSPETCDDALGWMPLPEVE